MNAFVLATAACIAGQVSLPQSNQPYPIVYGTPNATPYGYSAQGQTPPAKAPATQVTPAPAAVPAPAIQPAPGAPCASCGAASPCNTCCDSRPRLLQRLQDRLGCLTASLHQDSCGCKTAPACGCKTAPAPCGCKIAPAPCACKAAPSCGCQACGRPCLRRRLLAPCQTCNTCSACSSCGVAQPYVAPAIPAAPQKVEHTSPIGTSISQRYLNRIGHETDYSWVTGQLQYMHTNGGTWVVRYATVDTEDRFGGSVVLAPTVDMRNFREGDLISVHGDILNEGRAVPTLGGALYRAQHVDMIDRVD